MDTLKLTVGWTVVVFIICIGVHILYKIYKGEINLTKLISEPASGDASLSRLQFLIFTIVISMSLFLVIVGNGTTPAFPKEIPSEIFALLGISGGTYVVSKGIQSKRDTDMEKTKSQNQQQQSK